VAVRIAAALGDASLISFQAASDSSEVGLDFVTSRLGVFARRDVSVRLLNRGDGGRSGGFGGFDIRKIVFLGPGTFRGRCLRVASPCDMVETASTYEPTNVATCGWPIKEGVGMKPHRGGRRY
jgi:hypothetical protein